MPAWRAPLAWAYAQAGRAEVHRVLAELCRDGFAVLPRDVNFDAGLAILAHVADELGDAGLAAEIEPLLRPRARTIGSCSGSARRRSARSPTRSGSAAC